MKLFLNYAKLKVKSVKLKKNRANPEKPYE